MPLKEDFAIEWIESGGGPLLLAPRSSIKSWSGTLPTELQGNLTDYARACAVRDELGVITIGAKQALVLGDEPDRTALILQRTGELLILRWRWADSEESLLSAVLSSPGLSGMHFSPAGTLTALAEEYLLFDSACSGSAVTHSLSVELDAGTFTLGTAIFEPNKNTCALIHRMTTVRREPA